MDLRNELGRIGVEFVWSGSGRRFGCSFCGWEVGVGVEEIGRLRTATSNCLLAVSALLATPLAPATVPRRSGGRSER